MLDIKNLNVSVEEKQILKNLSLNVGKGEVQAKSEAKGGAKANAKTAAS